ncbi:MAG: zinc-finger domain-containing protein [Thiotrichales bacterium]|nr:zinc-finger domain-containing protein [Thiotrichales bacterium]
MSDPGTPRQQSPRTVSRKDIPLHCPMPQDSLWNAHPRVYLPIEDSGRETCPYCGAVYVLSDDPGPS